jgi:hypothetical protein
MANFGQQHAWAAGHGVALASLSNIANEVGARNRRTAGGKLFPVGIKSPLLDMYPVRRRVRAGYERGDGMVDTELNMTLALFGIKYILDTYLLSGAVVSAAMTFYLRRHELNTYVRGNGYLVLPKPGEDITYLRQGVYDVRFRVLDFEVL